MTLIHKPPNPAELRARLRVANRISSMQEQLVAHATTDFLTGLLNRRAFFERFKQTPDDARQASGLSAIIFDIDHFKRVNDTHGHEAGDRVLIEVGRAAKLADGIAVRLGGEEFCSLVRGGLEESIEAAEELRRLIRNLRSNASPAS